MAVYFIDRALGSNVAPDILRNAGLDVRIHDKIFPRDAADIEWIPVVAERGWVILTKDTRIRYNPLELRVVENSGARMFVLASKNLTGLQMGEAFTKAGRSMERFLGRKQPPFIAKVYKDGTVRGWRP